MWLTTVVDVACRLVCGQMCLAEVPLTKLHPSEWIDVVDAVVLRPIAGMLAKHGSVVRTDQPVVDSCVCCSQTRHWMPGRAPVSHQLVLSGGDAMSCQPPSIRTRRQRQERRRGCQTWTPPCPCVRKCYCTFYQRCGKQQASMTCGHAR